MSKWNHSICEQCFKAREPDRTPIKVDGGERELCCFCGSSTTDCIYIRHDPEELRCKGVHEL